MYVCVCVCVFVYLDEALQYLIMCVIQAGVQLDCLDFTQTFTKDCYGYFYFL